MHKLITLISLIFILLVVTTIPTQVHTAEFSYDFNLVGQVSANAHFTNGFKISIDQDIDQGLIHYYYNIFDLDLGNGTDITKTYSAKNLLDNESFNYFVNYLTTGYENGTIRCQVEFAKSNLLYGLSISKQCLFWGCDKLVINNPSLIDAKGMKIKDIVFEVQYARTLISTHEEDKGASKVKATLMVFTEDNKNNNIQSTTGLIQKNKRDYKKIKSNMDNKNMKKNNSNRSANKRINLVNNKFPTNEVTIVVDLQGKVYFQVFNNGVSTFKTPLETISWSNLKIYHDEQKQLIYTMHNEQGGIIIISEINYKQYNTSGLSISQSQTKYPFSSNYYNIGMAFNGKTISTLYFENTDDLTHSKSIIINYDIVKKVFGYIPVKIPSGFNSVDYSYYYNDIQKNIMYIILKVTKDCQFRSIVGINVNDGSITTTSPITKYTMLYIQPNSNVQFGNGTIIKSFSLGYENLYSANNLIAIYEFDLLNWTKSNMKPFDYLRGNLNACQVAMNGNGGKEIVKSVLSCSKQDNSGVFSFLYYNELTGQTFTQKVKADEKTYLIYLL
ncbi:hypothetical protein ABK040_007662 [Willaertia magna]